MFGEFQNFASEQLSAYLGDFESASGGLVPKTHPIPLFDHDRRHSICNPETFFSDAAAGSHAPIYDANFKPGSCVEDLLFEVPATSWFEPAANSPSKRRASCTTVDPSQDFGMGEGYLEAYPTGSSHEGFSEYSDTGISPGMYEIPSSIDPLRRHSSSSACASLFFCPWKGCGKAFNRFYNLRSHHRTHTQERPYPCRHCDQSFARNHDLRRHERTHSQDKPFGCPDCTRSFSRSDALLRHRSGASCHKRAGLQASDSDG